MTVVKSPTRGNALVSLALLALSSATVHAKGKSDDGFDNSYAIAPIPAWVATVAPGDAGPDADAVGGQRYLLVDRQSHDDGKAVAFHRHSVTKIVGQAGLSDNSNLSISFDPGYQRLELHTASVTRDGRKSDRLQQARIEIARTETESQDSLLHGEVTALIVLPDIRVGDQVTTRYTIHGRNPVFDARHHSSWRVRWRVPVERSVLRITVPEAMPMTHTPRPEINVSESATAGLRTLQWDWENLEPSETEDNIPGWLSDPDRLDVTAFRSWNEVAAWGTTLFEGHSAEGDTYRNLSESIQRVAAEQGLQSAIAMAIDHVQKRIRYYGVEVGENSHRPHSPDEVLLNGYGDCKDKTLLLVSLLNDLDVKAWPILVSSRIRKGVATRLPSPGLFNHVVVLVEHDGRRHWIDATDNGQSGLLGLRGQPEYGAGLVLGKPGEAIVTRTAPTPEFPTTSTHDQFYLSSMGGPVDLLTTTTYRGRDANRFGRRLDKSGKRRLRKDYLDYYRGIYGDLRPLEKLRITHDKPSNTITVQERYRLDEFWDIDKRSNRAGYDTYAISVRNTLQSYPDVDKYRKAPLATWGPARVAHKMQFFPNMASSERPLEERSFGTSGFEYRDSEYVMGNSLVFDSELIISTDTLMADKLKAYRKFHDRVMRNAQSGRYFPKAEADEIKLGSRTTALLEQLKGL